ncbi:hypothetical protein O3301_22050 [Janthinobacterium sp. SUN211]|uniref:hypothetical protein n=1 Tax=unclassified Janthinobacterium TaxID=2610881 RepID=UPI00271403C6|nr:MULTISPECIES: hypothetical protein [unclassified Janthinobacterium]MDO8039184.1 hypothetical protein [Janthinobacterium sp. SUN137]MDO8051156.1 hypothetical protein [Janthinobacterium sp. SUN211]
MTNLRIIYDNAGDRAVLTASSQADALGPANLQREGKFSVLRSLGLALTITATWPTPEIIGCVALPFCNLTPTATIRVRGYVEPGDAVPDFDTGIVSACEYAVLGMWDWGALPLGVNAFSYGGGTYARCWLPMVSVKKLVIELADPDNPAGYIEAARLVAGPYWSPEQNASYGAGVMSVDTSTQNRDGAGGQTVARGALYRKLSLALDHMTPLDRAEVWRIVRGNGLSRPLLVSLYPESDDGELEQAHQVYGRIASNSAITTPYYLAYATNIEIEEM